MSDSNGTSWKATLRNPLKMQLPSYVTRRQLRTVIEPNRRKQQPRNTICVCGSGLKFKLCCGRPNESEET